MDPVSFTRQLIDIPSVTGSEAEVASFLEKYCTSRGYRCERQVIEENRWNLFVNWEDRVDIVFCTHIDTVPPFFPSSESEREVIGRGACDTKGIIAAMLASGERISERGSVPSYLFVVGEETNSIGAKTAAHTGRSARYIVVGEPTENTLAVGHKGVLSYTLETTGRTAHSAYPDRGSSAIHALLDLLHEIRSCDWGNDPELGPATLNVGLIDGGIAPNVFADRASASVVHRLVSPLEEQKHILHSIIDGRASITINAENDPQRMFVPDGFPTSAVSFGTDIPYLRSMATPLLAGPGSIHDAHTENERLSKAQLFEAIDLYERLYFTLKDIE